jgi:O-antigen/teichoic acid export membrane protein
MSAAVTSKRGILTNAAVSVAGYAAQLLVAFFLCPRLVHGLGDRHYGMWALVESILAYLTLFDLGVAASVVRYVSRLVATEDRAGVNRIFSTSLCIFSVAGAAALLVALGLAFGALPWLGVPAELMHETRWLLILLGLNLALGLPLHVFAAVLDGLGRYPAKTAISTTAVLCRVPLFLLVLYRGGGLVELGWSITAISLAEQGALALAARHYLPGLRFSFRQVRWSTFRMIRGYSLDAFLAMVAGRISFQTDALVIALFLAPSFITFFAVAARLVEYGKSLLFSAITVLTPAVSAFEARGDVEAIRRVLFASTRWALWIVVPLQMGLLFLGRPFLLLWLGPYHAAHSFPVLLILAVPLSLAISQAVSARILYGMGRLRWLARAVLVEALANLLLSMVLARPLGIAGVALGTALPNVCMNLVLFGYICRSLEVRPREYVRRAFAVPACSGLVLAGFWWVAGQRLPPADWGTFLAMGTAGMLLWLLPAVQTEVGWRALLAAAWAAAKQNGSPRCPAAVTIIGKPNPPAQRNPADDAPPPSACADLALRWPGGSGRRQG